MIRLDDRDLEILRAVSQDGRITKAGLSERVGLSPSAAWDRLKKLERAGLISGYGARIALKKITPHVTVFVVLDIGDHTAASFRNFETGIQAFDEVTGCWALGGGLDYLLQVQTRDMDSYQSFIDEMLDAGIGVHRYFTYVVTKLVKSTTAPPFELLLGAGDCPLD